MTFRGGVLKSQEKSLIASSSSCVCRPQLFIPLSFWASSTFLNSSLPLWCFVLLYLLFHSFNRWIVHEDKTRKKNFPQFFKKPETAILLSIKKKNENSNFLSHTLLTMVPMTTFLTMVEIESTDAERNSRDSNYFQVIFKKSRNEKNLEKFPPLEK